MNNCFVGKVTKPPMTVTYNEDIAYVSFNVEAERFMPLSGEYITYNYQVNVYDRWLRRDVFTSVNTGDYVVISGSSTSIGIVADDVKLLHTNGSVSCSNLHDH